MMDFLQHFCLNLVSVRKDVVQEEWLLLLTAKMALPSIQQLGGKQETLRKV